MNQVHSDNNSSTKIFLNNVTGMTAASGYINYQNNVVVVEGKNVLDPLGVREPGLDGSWAATDVCHVGV